MECASAINVTITESTMEHLISNTVDILKSKAVDKLQGNEREKTHTIIRTTHKKGTSYEWAGGNDTGICDYTKGNSPFEGYGTALKPAREDWILMRKPLAEKTVAENVLKYGTGGINIDESRVESNEDMSNIKAFGSMPENKSDNKGFSRPWMNDKQSILDKQNAAIDKMKGLGRFPANLILSADEDGQVSEEVRECFPDTKSGKLKSDCYEKDRKNDSMFAGGENFTHKGYEADSGNASRFFKSIEQVVDLNDFSIYNISILTNIKQLCGQHLTKKKTGIMLGGVIKEAEKFIQDAELLMSGNSTTIEEFLTDIVSTTKTLIAQMTELKTLNVLPNWLITKFTEESEKTIKSLKELNTEDVKSAKSIFLLQTFISEVLESIRAIAEIVVEKDSNNGEKVSDNSRFFKSIVYVPKPSKKERNAGCEGLEEKRGGSMEANTTDKMQLGGASLKGEPKKIQSTKNNHPTVKPIALMEYLIKMITPKGGTVLDPFMGSGSTGVAAIQNDFDFIGIDMTPEYIEIAKARINHAKKIKDNKLF
jgi:hypothetical protein